jgi:shikimate kinase
VNSGKSIVLIGFMGAGKSSIGRRLQQRTGLVRFDTDEIVASKFGMSIAEIFSKYGEERFREAETEVVRELPPAKQAIIVTGGGIVLREENVDLLKRLRAVVWLEADEETLFERASRKGDRPLLKTANPRETFSEMLRARTPLYAKMADVRVDTSAFTHDEVVDKILIEIENSRAMQR